MCRCGGGPPAFDTALDVGRTHLSRRRTNRQAVFVDVEGPTFDATSLVVGIDVPCNKSLAHVTATLYLQDPKDGSTLGAPPEVAITTPSSVSCGVPTALTATVTDRDGDLASTRWKIDGVLMAEGTSAVTFTGPHELELVARDARGAATTDRRMIQCL